MDAIATHDQHTNITTMDHLSEHQTTSTTADGDKYSNLPNSNQKFDYFVVL